MKNSSSSRILQDSPFRFFVSLAVFLVSLLLSSQKPPIHFVYLMLIFIANGLVFGSAYLIAQKKDLSSYWSYVLVAADVISISAAILMTGQLESPLFVLYLAIFGLCLYHNETKQFIYAVVLSACLYAAILGAAVFEQQAGLLKAVGQLLLMGFITGVLYSILSYVHKERTGNRRLLSQSQALSKICSLMSGPLTKPKDIIRAISQLLDQELGGYGVHCRINIHKSGEFFIPPSGGHVAINVPILIGDQIGGTLMVHRKEGYVPTSNDTYFFSTVANAIGLYCHRARIWDDFQSHLEKIEASLLLNSSNNPKDNEKAILSGHHKDVRNMIDVVRLERGQWTLEKSAMDFKSLVYEEIESGMSRYADKNIKLVLDGSFQNIPVMVGDPHKLHQLFQTIVHIMASSSPEDGTIKISVRFDHAYVTFNFEDQGDGGSAGPLTMSFAKIFDKKNSDGEPHETLLNWGLVTCKKIVDAHKGNIWAESKGPGKGRFFSFSLPFTPDEHLNNTLRITSEILERLNS